MAGFKKSSEIWPDIKARLLSQVVEVDSGCLEWQGGRDKDGYGKLKWDGKHYRTHRVSWEVHFGSIPEEMWVLHSCDNPSCCNPAHLFLGTAQINNDDMWAKNRACPPVGEGSGGAVLTADEVREIRRLLSDRPWLTLDHIGDKFGVTGGAILAIKTGRNWKKVQ